MKRVWGNGLSVLTDDDKIDTILISGMGTSTILKILDNPYLNKIDKLIIQSNMIITNCAKISQAEAFDKSRRFLVDNNKHYINIVFVRGNKKYSKKELKYGPVLIHNKNYLNFELSNCQKIYNLIPRMKLRYRLKLKREMNLLKNTIKGKRLIVWSANIWIKL